MYPWLFWLGCPADKAPVSETPTLTTSTSPTLPSPTDSGEPPTCRFSGDLSAEDHAFATFAIPGAGYRWGLDDLDGDGLDDVAIGANYADTVYLYFGARAGELGPGDADAVISAPGRFGAGIVSPGDRTGDGVADLWISAPYDGDTGRVYFLPGPFEGAVGAGSTYVLGPEEEGRIGHSLAHAGDVTGDGLLEVVVNAWQPAHAFILGEPPLSNDVQEVAVATLISEQRGLFAVGAGDVTGDGVGDLLAGALVDAYLVAGPVAGVVELVAVAEATYTHTAGFEDTAGQTIAAGSDVTGDGSLDLLVGDILGGGGGQGLGWLFEGSRRGIMDAIEADVTFRGDEDEEYSGLVQSPGDLDGDGVGDVLIGSTYIPPSETFVFYGPLAGSYRTSDADAVFREVVPGGIAYDVGSDTDGDGCMEIWVGGADVVYQLRP